MMTATTARVANRLRRLFSGHFLLCSQYLQVRFSSQASQTIGDYQLVSEVRQSRTVSLFTYRATLRNANGALSGASSLVATIANSNAVVAEIDPNGGANPGAQSQTATIVAGASSTPFNTAGGLAFDPLSAGQTTVTATIANFIRTTAGAKTVTVNP